MAQRTKAYLRGEARFHDRDGELKIVELLLSAASASFVADSITAYGTWRMSTKLRRVISADPGVSGAVRHYDGEGYWRSASYPGRRVSASVELRVVPKPERGGCEVSGDIHEEGQQWSFDCFVPLVGGAVWTEDEKPKKVDVASHGELPRVHESRLSASRRDAAVRMMRAIEPPKLPESPSSVYSAADDTESLSWWIAKAGARLIVVVGVAYGLMVIGERILLWFRAT